MLIKVNHAQLDGLGGDIQGNINEVTGQLQALATAAERNRADWKDGAGAVWQEVTEDLRRLMDTAQELAAAARHAVLVSNDEYRDAAEAARRMVAG